MSHLTVSAVHRMPAELMWEVIWDSDLSHRDIYNLCLIRPFSDVAHRALYRRIPRNLHDHLAAATYIRENCREHEGSTLVLVPTVALPNSELRTGRVELTKKCLPLEASSTVKRIIARSPFYQEGFSHIDIQNYTLLNITQHYPLNSLGAFEGHGIELSLPFLSFLTKLISKSLTKLILNITRVPLHFHDTILSPEIQNKLTSILKAAFPSLKTLGLSLGFLPPALIRAVTTNRALEEVILFDHSESRWPKHILSYGGFSQMRETLDQVNAAGVSESVWRATVSYNGMYYGDFDVISRAFPRLRELTLISRSDFFEQRPNELAWKLKVFPNLTDLKIQGTFTPTTQLPPNAKLTDSDWTNDNIKSDNPQEKISVNLERKFWKTIFGGPPLPALVRNLFLVCMGLNSLEVNITLERRVDGHLEALMDAFIDAILKPSNGFQTGWN